MEAHEQGSVEREKLTWETEERIVKVGEKVGCGAAAGGGGRFWVGEPEIFVRMPVVLRYNWQLINGNLC